MLTPEELNIIYDWGMTTELPYRSAPTAVGYSNKEIDMCWLKATKEDLALIRKPIMDPEVIEILEKPEIIFATGALFYEGTVLGPHKDPNCYNGVRYSRIHIPLVVDPEKCYMVWHGERVYWESGVFSQWDVQDHVHEAYNESDEPMEFIFLDIRK